MFCPECGTKLDDDAIFCPECGTKVIEDSIPVVDVTNIDREVPVTMRGYILTNLRTLASRLGAEIYDLRAILNAYIKSVRELGVEYKLLDAGDYKYLKTSLLGGGVDTSL